MTKPAMWRLVLAIAWLLLGRTVAAQIDLVDDLGHRLSLPGPAQRIVSLSPHITELLFDAGAGDNLVATVAYSDYPPAARALPRIGDAGRVDQERLLRLAPDLVIAWGSGTPQREQQAIRRLGLTLYLSEPRRLQSIPHQLRQFGRLSGRSRTAEQAALRFERDLAALRARYAERVPRRVFYQLAAAPLLTVNQSHIIQDVLTLCGAVNPFAGLPELTPRVAVEAVLQSRPAAIIQALYPGESLDATRAFWSRFGMPAETRYIGIPGDHIHRQTARILLGIDQLCRTL